MPSLKARSSIKAIVIAAALGYAVDLFDTFLLPALRVPALRDLGISSSASLAVGTNIFNLQLLGQALGALLLWGPLSDRSGRRRMMFASILLYGVANLATALSPNLILFVLFRFIAGIGLGGQLGAGIVLIAESSENSRGRTRGAMVVGCIGMLGVVAAGLLARSSLSWRTDYVIGGVVALLVMLFRKGTKESAIFEESSLQKPSSYWVGLAYLFRPRHFLKFTACVLMGTPIFFVIGLVVSGAPEFGVAMGLHPAPTSADALVWTYLSIALGDVLCGLLTEAIESRKLAILLFHAISLIGIGALLLYPPHSTAGYYWRCSLAGLGIGYWANLVTSTAEQWGTNLRGTATIAVPNFVRVLLFPISACFLILRGHIGLLRAASLVGFTCVGIGIVATLLMRDGYKRDDLAFDEAY